MNTILNRLFKGILLTIFCVLMAQAAFAAFEPAQRMSSARLVTQPSAVRPQATMTSTSAYINASAPQMSYKQVSNHRSASATPMSMRPLRATSAATVHTVGTQGGVSVGTLSNNISTRRTYAAGQTGIAGIHAVSLPALSITEKNIAYAGSTIADEEQLNPSRPRRVNGEDDDDNSDDPFIDGNHTPVGDVPFIFFALLIVAFCAYRYKDKLKTKRSF